MKHDLKKHLIFISYIVTSVIILVVLIYLPMRQDAWEKSLGTFSSEILALQSSNNELSESLYQVIEENYCLKQDILAARQKAEFWENYAENLTASVVYVPEYHEQTTVQEVEVDKLVYINNEWREFESLAVLTDWAEEHLAYLWIVGDKLADCDDYASRLQAQAFRDGYLLSLQIVKDGMLNGKNVSNYAELHMGNLAMIGDDIYFIEPQPEYFRVVFVCHRD